MNEDKLNRLGFLAGSLILALVIAAIVFFNTTGIVLGSIIVITCSVLGASYIYSVYHSFKVYRDERDNIQENNGYPSFKVFLFLYQTMFSSTLLAISVPLIIAAFTPISPVVLLAISLIFFSVAIVAFMAVEKLANNAIKRLDNNSHGTNPFIAGSSAHDRFAGNQFNLDRGLNSEQDEYGQGSNAKGP